MVRVNTFSVWISWMKTGTSSLPTRFQPSCSRPRWTCLGWRFNLNAGDGLKRVRPARSSVADETGPDTVKQASERYRRSLQRLGHPRGVGLLIVAGRRVRTQGNLPKRARANGRDHVEFHHQQPSCPDFTLSVSGHQNATDTLVWCVCCSTTDAPKRG